LKKILKSSPSLLMGQKPFIDVCMAIERLAMAELP